MEDFEARSKSMKEKFNKRQTKISDEFRETTNQNVSSIFATAFYTKKETSRTL